VGRGRGLGDRQDSVDIAVSGSDFRGVVSGLLADPELRLTVPRVIASAAVGDLRAVGGRILRDRAPTSIGSAMAHAMLCASGASAGRRRTMVEEAGRSVLAPTPNIALSNCDVWGVPDLGDGFREPVRSEIPTLLISGTLDLTTPVANADAVLAGLTKGEHLIVEGARHGDDLVVGPTVIRAMIRFLSGQRATDLR
jgi:pimeloyl-ACP methyl ester carboxylesterase